MEKIIQTLIDSWTKGVDTYTHNGSTWLIFTDNKQWVIELTDSKTLWYNYNFFKQIFEFTSLDVVENQQYITKWVEDNVINKVKDTILEKNITEGEVEEIIENGVKETSHNATMFQSMKVEDTIQNGVRHILNTEYMPTSMVEDIIENGVKETKLHKGVRPSAVEVTIKNGVSRENSSPFIPSWILVEDAIKHGVKETKGHGFEQQNIIDDIVKDGVKETKTPGNGDILSTIEWMEENKSTSYTKMIDDVIDYGIKKTMLRQHITDGNVETVLNCGVKETFDTEFMPKSIVNDIIQNGTKNPSV